MCAEGGLSCFQKLATAGTNLGWLFKAANGGFCQSHTQSEVFHKLTMLYGAQSVVFKMPRVAILQPTYPNIEKHSSSGVSGVITVLAHSVLAISTAKAIFRNE